MKLQFTKMEFNAFVANITEIGYKKYSGFLKTSDYYFAKTLHKSEPNEYGETRNDLVVLLLVYDFSKYEQFPDNHYMHIQAEICVSRNIDERIEMVTDNNQFETIPEFEVIAHKFYNFICSL